MPSDDPVSYGGQTGSGGLPGPLRHFADRLAKARSAEVFDVDQAGRVLVELAADAEFFGPLIAQLPAGSPGSRWLIRPERGPRLVLVHRPEAVMGYTHSHRCWVAIAPVRGVETHQRWDAVREAGGRAELRLADERALVQGDVATLVPPRDVRNHGHVAGSGPSPYSLILLGDDMLLFDREAMKNSAFVGIALSWSATISRFGVAAGGFTVVASPSAAAVIGRWTTDAIATCARDRPPAYTEAKSAGLM